MYPTPKELEEIYNRPAAFTYISTFSSFPRLFREEVRNILIKNKILVEEPEQLHKLLTDKQKTYNIDDGVNEISKIFYDTSKTLNILYLSFIRSIVNTMVPFDRPFYFQKTPTIRIHCPNSPNSHHYPRYHSDIFYGHPPEEYNIWIPLTCKGQDQVHGFRMFPFSHSKELMEKYHYNAEEFIYDAIHAKEEITIDTTPPEMDAPLNSIVVFDPRCIHSAETMLSHTRISMDIRICPVSAYKKRLRNYKGTGRKKIKFSPGEAYHEKHSHEV